jgi:hypothetical protein
MSFAKIVPTNNAHPFEWFEVGEFFRFEGDIWVKYNSHGAVNISRGIEENQDFDSDVSCENVDVELKVL